MSLQYNTRVQCSTFHFFRQLITSNIVQRARIRCFEDHGEFALEWATDWSLAEKLIPLLEPRELPEYYSLTKVPSEFVDASLRFFPFLFQPQNPAWVAQFEALCLQPPFTELNEVFDDDGIFSDFSDNFSLDEKALMLLQGNNNVENDETVKRMSIQVNDFNTFIA